MSDPVAPPAPVRPPRPLELWVRAIPVAIAVGWVLEEWVRILVRQTIEGDFSNHYVFARNFVRGEFIYGKDGSLNYVYLPLWAMIHAPLTLLPERAAAFVIYPVAPASVALILWLLQRLARTQRSVDGTRLFWAATAAVVLAAPFLVRDLPLCGANTALLALALSGIYFWTMGRDGMGGACLGLSIALKATPLLLWAWLLWKRQWKMAGATAAFAIAFTLAPALRQGWGGPAGYAAHIRHWWNMAVVPQLSQIDPSQGVLVIDDPIRGPVREEGLNNLALKPALARYLMHLPPGHQGRPETHEPEGPNDPPNPLYLQFLELSPSAAGVVVKVTMAALLAVIFWSFLHPITARNDPAILWECAAILVLILLYSPVTWKQHCVGVLPAWYLWCRSMTTRVRLPRWMFGATAFYVVAVVVLNRGLIGANATHLLDSYHLKTMALLSLLAVTVICARRAATCPTPSTMDLKASPIQGVS
jgi:alpha-1,2-mannosyltransferase